MSRLYADALDIKYSSECLDELEDKGGELLHLFENVIGCGETHNFASKIEPCEVMRKYNLHIKICRKLSNGS